MSQVESQQLLPKNGLYFWAEQSHAAPDASGRNRKAASTRSCKRPTSEVIRVAQ